MQISDPRHVAPAGRVPLRHVMTCESGAAPFSPAQCMVAGQQSFAAKEKNTELQTLGQPGNGQPWSCLQGAPQHLGDACWGGIDGGDHLLVAIEHTDLHSRHTTSDCSARWQQCRECAPEGMSVDSTWNKATAASLQVGKANLYVAVSTLHALPLGGPNLSIDRSRPGCSLGNKFGSRAHLLCVLKRGRAWPSASTSMMTESPSLMSPLSMRSAMLSSSSRMIARRSGRAPYAGLYPSSTSRSCARKRSAVSTAGCEDHHLFTA